MINQYVYHEIVNENLVNEIMNDELVNMPEFSIDQWNEEFIKQGMGGWEIEQMITQDKIKMHEEDKIKEH